MSIGVHKYVHCVYPCIHFCVYKCPFLVLSIFVIVLYLSFDNVDRSDLVRFDSRLVLEPVHSLRPSFFLHNDLKLQMSGKVL